MSNPVDSRAEVPESLASDETDPHAELSQVERDRPTNGRVPWRRDAASLGIQRIARSSYGGRTARPVTSGCGVVTSQYTPKR